MKRYAVLFVILVAADKATKNLLPTVEWGWDPRPFTASHLLGVAAAAAFLLYPPVRFAGTILLAGIVGNVTSAWFGPVANPFVVGDVAFNLADVLLLCGMFVAMGSSFSIFRDVRRRGLARGWTW